MQHLLYCTDSLSLDSFHNLLSSFTSIKNLLDLQFFVNGLSVLLCCTVSSEDGCQ